MVDLTACAIVNVDVDGRATSRPPGIVGVSATSGALWGMLIGLLFFVPVVGPAAGRRDGRPVRQARQVRG